MVRVQIARTCNCLASRSSGDGHVLQTGISRNSRVRRRETAEGMALPEQMLVNLGIKR